MSRAALSRTILTIAAAVLFTAPADARDRIHVYTVVLDAKPVAQRLSQIINGETKGLSLRGQIEDHLFFIKIEVVLNRTDLRIAEQPILQIEAGRLQDFGGCA